MNNWQLFNYFIQRGDKIFLTTLCNISPLRNTCAIWSSTTARHCIKFNEIISAIFFFMCDIFDATLLSSLTIAATAITYRCCPHRQKLLITMPFTGSLSFHRDLNTRCVGEVGWRCFGILSWVYLHSLSKTTHLTIHLTREEWTDWEFRNVVIQPQTHAVWKPKTKNTNWYAVLSSQWVTIHPSYSTYVCRLTVFNEYLHHLGTSFGERSTATVVRVFTVMWVIACLYPDVCVVHWVTPCCGYL